ncbi:MAG TPA: hypothetical protein VEG61_02265 [Candidatus Dormibacteraeota bacterium]|nr:hypothetical protein [Candidatus Dormibacteraeota bacterium]
MRALIYLLQCQPATNDMTAHQNLLAALFLILSIFCLTPTLTRAGQSQPETIIIDASGQATAIGSGPSGATSLNLTADAYKNSNGWLIIQNTTGVLQIGSTAFTITGGHGSVTEVGAIAIFADTATGKGQLILQGTMNGDAVTFATPSQLASKSYITLYGDINSAKQTAAPTTSITINSPITVENVTTLTSSLNVTQHTNSTSTLSNSQLRNTTTQANTSLTPTAIVTVGVTNTTANFAAASSSIIENGTSSKNNGTGQHSVTIHVVQGQGEICLSSQDHMPVCTTASQTIPVNNGELVNFDATADTGFTWDHYDGLGIGQAQNFNAAITQDTATGVYFTPMSTTNATAAISLPTYSTTTTRSSNNSITTTLIANNITIPVPSNVTVTVTQYVNQTVSVTQTVGTSTISYTVTSTVAITTMTQENVTLAVSSTTTV